MKIWIMVANSSIGYIYKTDNLRNNDLTLVQEFSHPQSREKGIEVLTDRPGHFSTDHTARGAYEKIEPKEMEADHFARELVNALNRGHNNHEFEQLIVVAAPHFYGLINKHLKFTNDNILHVPKDYTKIKGRDLLENLRDYLYK